MKKILIGTIAGSLIFGLATSASAQNTKQELRQNVRQERQDAKAAIRDARQDNRASGSAEKNNRARVSNADLTAINGTTLTIMKEGKTYTVTTDAQTAFRRHYGGASSLAEFSVGNKVDVRGTYTGDAQTTIAASRIRNRSIMMRRGTFIGEVASKSGNTFVLKTKSRGDQTVTVTGTTKYVNRQQQVITVGDIVDGHRIRVKGMWDKSKNTVTQVTQVKDFSLPPKATDTETSSPSANTSP